MWTDNAFGLLGRAAVCGGIALVGLLFIAADLVGAWVVGTALLIAGGALAAGFMALTGEEIAQGDDDER